MFYTDFWSLGYYNRNNNKLSGLQGNSSSERLYHGYSGISGYSGYSGMSGYSGLSPTTRSDNSVMNYVSNSPQKSKNIEWYNSTFKKKASSYGVSI